MADNDPTYEPERGPVGYPPRTPAWVHAERLGGRARRARILPGGAAAPAALAPPQLMVFPAYYFPPDGATPWLVQGSTTGLVAGAAATLGAFTLPNNEQGVLRSIAIGVAGLTVTSNVRFSVRVNGGAIPAYGDILFPPQPTAFGAFSFGPDETRYDIPAGALVELVVFVPAGGGGPYDATGTLHGWHWGNE